MFQTVGSDLVNFSLDNVLLANSRGIVAKAGANIVPGEPIYPGKIWITDGPVNQEFSSFQLADVYPSLQNLHGLVQAMGEKRTGISDIQLGNMQNLPGRTPATTMLSLLQEGSRRPDLTLKVVAGQNPALAPVATQAASGLQELFKRLLEEYDIRNPEKILPLGGEPAQSMAPPPNPLAALLGGGAGGAPGGAPAGPSGAGS